MRPVPAKRQRRRWHPRKPSVFTAELQHSGLGEALVAQQAARRSSATAREEGAQLAVAAPIGGVVATANPENLVNRDVTTGETLLTIVDPSQLVARLFVPVSEMDRVRVGDPVSLQLPFQFCRNSRAAWGRWKAPQCLPPAGLLAEQEYKGIALPTFYTTRMPLGEMGEGIRPGMSGQAKIFGRRRSLADRIVTAAANTLHAHFW